jgi:hypothetical protein
MSNKSERTEKEMQNLFKDPKFSRQAWKAVGAAILASPCDRTVGSYDKDGNIDLAGSIEQYSYASLKRDIDTLAEANAGKKREPTELEMILQCQIVKARFDTSAAIFVRDTLGAKPIDETKLDAQINNPYEELSDDELEALAAMRAAKEKEDTATAVQNEDDET